jgi:hypothetical protein
MSKINPTSVVNVNYHHLEIQLLTELNDITAEQISGGNISTPETKTGENSTTTETPVGIALIPSYPALPPRKLAALSPLKPSTIKSSKT